MALAPEEGLLKMMAVIVLPTPVTPLVENLA
jgi:hypothetical protein